MKRITTFVVATLVALTSLMACAQNSKSKNAETMDGKKVLVAYFSWSGNTADVAKYVASKTGADLFEVVREKAYPVDYTPCTDEAKAEKERGDRPAIKGEVKNMEQYDVVFVGVPVWWYTAPMPVFTFLDKYDFGGKTVIPFCTAYTAEYETLNDIVAATPNSSHLEGLTLITKEMGGKGMDKQYGTIDQWLNKLNF
ncbi:MAG: hypothetical protein IJ761_03030 [Bacteroidales bacterium]|nr:hypothetical protein [Bacteroidales bacterium]